MFAHFFISRPVFAVVISILIVLAGTLALTQLPIAQYPEVVPPQVVVTAIYPGADARTVSETVASPIEDQVNGVEGMLYMESQYHRRTMQRTITPRPNQPDSGGAVQNRVASPPEVSGGRRLGVVNGAAVHRYCWPPTLTVKAANDQEVLEQRAAAAGMPTLREERAA